MDFTLHPFKQIEFGDMAVFPVNDYVDTELVHSYYVYPSETDHEVPIQVTWRFRVFYNESHIFSYVGESRATINNKKMPPSSVALLVTNLYFQFSQNWDQQVELQGRKGMPLQGITQQQFEELKGNITDLLN